MKLDTYSSQLVEAVSGSQLDRAEIREKTMSKVCS